MTPNLREQFSLQNNNSPMRSLVKTLVVGFVAMLSFFSAVTVSAAPNAYVLTYYDVNPGATVQIDEWGVCFNVTNGAQNPAVYVPTKTAAEWASFYNHVPPNVSLAACGGTLPGCTDNTATNYNAAATVNDGSCVYAPGCDLNAGNPCISTPNVCGQTNIGSIQCNGSCDAVTPGNGSCIIVVNGCTDPSATNYNASANVDDGSCLYPPGCVPTAGTACVSGSNICGQTDTGVVQCNGSCNAVTPPDTNCPVTILGCTDPSATNYNPAATFDDGSCAYAPICVANAGQSCTSAANACGQTGSGTVQCDGSCSASIPSVPANLGAACPSNGNNCGDTNLGTIQCDSTCSASQPADRGSCTVCSNAGQPCTSGANACGQTASGTIDAGTCTCNANPPAVPANLGSSCTSATNACGQTGSGTIQCDSSCSAAVPAVPANLGAPCSTGANACGQVGAGTIQCDNSCSAGIPSLPGNYGDPCASAANNCGMSNTGSIGCTNNCSASTPSDVPNVGMGCTSGPNNCGDRGSGSFQCNGSCSAAQPGDVANIGTACVSAANNCGDTSVGTVQCGGCDASAPADRVCGPIAVSGCTDPMADNYDPGATVDNGSCYRTGCTDPMADNYDPNATGGGACTYSVNYGCTDPAAMNHDPFANADDGSCLYQPSCVPQVCNGAAYWDEGSCSCACAPFYHEENGSCVADAMDPCLTDPWLVGCIGDPCLIDPFMPGCGDPCLLDPGFPGCGPIDPCATDPNGPTCPCPNADEVRMSDGSCAIDCLVNPGACQQGCVVGDSDYDECMCTQAGKSWDPGYQVCY